MHDLVSIERKIGEIFERELNLTVPSPATDLFESGGLDSLSFVDLLLQIERAFGLRIQLQDLELVHFRSIGRIAAFIRGRLQAAAMTPQPALESIFDEPPGAARIYGEVKCPA